MNHTHARLLGLDVGGTAIKAGIVTRTEHGTTMEPPIRVPVDSSSPDAESILDALALASALGDGGDVDAVGVAICGPFDVAGGYFLRTRGKYAALYGHDLHEVLGARHGAPVYFVPDLDAASAGLGVDDSLRNVLNTSDALVISLGTHAAHFLRHPTGAIDLSLEDYWLRALDGVAPMFGQVSRWFEDHYGEACDSLSGRARRGSVEAQEAFVEFGGRLAGPILALHEEAQFSTVVITGGMHGAFDLFGAALRAGAPGLDIRVPSLPEPSLVGALVAGGLLDE